MRHCIGQFSRFLRTNAVAAAPAPASNIPAIPASPVLGGVFADFFEVVFTAAVVFAAVVVVVAAASVVVVVVVDETDGGAGMGGRPGCSSRYVSGSIRPFIVNTILISSSIEVPRSLKEASLLFIYVCFRG